MKKVMWSLFVSVVTTVAVHGQGEIWVHNPQAPARVGSMNGPLAGPGFWGQMLAGPMANALFPIGVPDELNAGGYVDGGRTTVPNVPCFQDGYVQLVVWNGALWGTVFENVPTNQRGVTDIVLLPMNCFTVPIFAPQFKQPAIVPVPEPTVSALVLAGAALLAVASRQRLCGPSK